MEQRGVGAGGDEEEVGEFEEEEEDAAVVECSRKQTRKIQPEKRVDYGTKWRQMLYSISLCFSHPLLFSPGMIFYKFPLNWEVGRAHVFAKFNKSTKHSI